MEFARDPRLLGAEIGFFSVLHTWNQKLEHHPHVHCVVPEGGLAPDGSRWVRPRYDFFLPVKAMAKAFRGKFLDALREAFAAGELRFPGQMKNLAAPRAFAALLRQCCRHKWVVYAKRPFGGPEHVLQYLGNYTHRIAISNHRLVALEDGKVSFRWRDSAHKNKQRVMTLARGGVPAALLPARAAAGLRAHPPLRVVLPTGCGRSRWRFAGSLLAEARRQRPVALRRQPDAHRPVSGAARTAAA